MQCVHDASFIKLKRTRGVCTLMILEGGFNQRYKHVGGGENMHDSFLANSHIRMSHTNKFHCIR